MADSEGDAEGVAEALAVAVRDARGDALWTSNVLEEGSEGDGAEAVVVVCCDSELHAAKKAALLRPMTLSAVRRVKGDDMRAVPFKILVCE